MSTKRFRLNYMETLGFFDSPSAESTDQWSDSPRQRPSENGKAVMVLDKPGHNRAELSPSQTQTLDAWKPSAANSGLSRSNIRWPTILVSLVIAMGLGVGAFLIYQRSESMTTVVVEDVTRQALVVSALLETLEPLAAEQEISAGSDTASAVVVDVNEAARELFSLAGSLPDSESATRVAASDAASLTLNATRKLIDTRVFYSALEPALIPPALETDSSLVDIAAAAQDFGSWRAYLTTVDGALPDGVSSGVSTQLSLLLASLDAVQSEYLDALRAEGRFAATAVLDSIAHELDLIRFSLNDSVSASSVDIQADIASARESLDDLLG